MDVRKVDPQRLHVGTCGDSPNGLGGKKLGRPQIPFLGEATDHVLVLEYERYATDAYYDYYANQLLLSRTVA